MKAGNRVVIGAVLGVLALIGIGMNISAAPAVAAGSAPVTIVNPSPIPVTGTITGQITGQVAISNQPTVNAVQSGQWNVNVAGMDTANAHLTNIQNSVAALQFDQAGSLYTALRSPVQTTVAKVSKSFTQFFRLDPHGLSDTIPITAGGAPTTLNLTMFALITGHDNQSVYVKGPFQTDGNVGWDFLPVALNSQGTMTTFPTPIPVTSFFATCNNDVDHCDFGVTFVGY